MTGLREAAFARHVDEVGGTEGVKGLATEGHAAHEVSAELQELARTNTPGTAKTAARADRRFRADVILLTLVIAVGTLWLADNAFGYAFSTKQTMRVTSAGVRKTVDAPGVRGASADCWASEGAVRGWEAGAPFGSLIQYRCGEGALAAAIPGPLSAVAALLVLLAACALRLIWRRRQKLAWY